MVYIGDMDNDIHNNGNKHIDALENVVRRCIMDKDFNRTFDSCPVCSSTRRFCEELGQEIKDRGLTRPNWIYNFDVRQGVVMDASKQRSIPIGSTLPGFIIHTDICMDCGCIYAVRLARLEGKVGLPPATQMPPGGMPGGLPFSPS